MNDEAKLTIIRPVMVGYVSATISALLFGSVSTIAKPILYDINPLLLSSLVYLISGLTLTPIARNLGQHFEKKDYLLLIITAISGAVIAPAMFFFGLKQSSASNSSVLINGEIIFSILLAILFFKEKLNPVGFASVALVLIGVMIITTNLDFNNLQLKADDGNLLIVGATFFWGLDNNISKILSHKMPIPKLIQLKSFIGGTILLGLTLLLGIPVIINLAQIPYIVLLGIVGFAASLYFFLQSLRKIGTVKTILIFSFSSLFGLVLAWTLLREQITIYQIIAAGIMVTGIYLINREGSISDDINLNFRRLKASDKRK
jgi:drug/metabolite transporter (DMT)-like permease